MAVEKRLFVGGFTTHIDECCVELFTRFQKFGRCLSDAFETHDSFAFINMNFEDENAYQKLRRSFNGMKYKGNTLKIDVAKLNWQERWKLENSKVDQLEKIKKDQILKREWEHYKKLENIKKTWLDRIQVHCGRMRKTPRPKSQLRNITFRINRDGHLKVYKCYKTKLWGYERNKKARDLAYKFVDSHWQDGNNHIIDRLDYSRCKRPIFSRYRACNPSLGTEVNGNNFEEPEEDYEKYQYEKILNSVLDGYDFDKPLDLDDDEENASSDYEYNAIFQESESKIKNEKPLKLKKANESSIESPIIDTPFKTISTPDENHTNNIEPLKEKKTAEKSTTEKLRSLFNPEEPANKLFSLVEESEGELYDNEPLNNALREEEEKQQEEKQQEEEAQMVLKQQFIKSSAKGLFFSHINSPFLHSQSTLAKLNSTSGGPEKLFDSWEERFWDNRGLWTREMKNKKRDAIRQLNKQNGRTKGNSILL